MKALLHTPLAFHAVLVFLLAVMPWSTPRLLAQDEPAVESQTLWVHDISDLMDEALVLVEGDFFNGDGTPFLLPSDPRFLTMRPPFGSAQDDSAAPLSARSRTPNEKPADLIWQIQELRLVQGEFLGGAVSALIDPPFSGQGTLRVSRDTLIVFGTAEQNGWIKEFLRRQRDQNVVLDVEVRRLIVSDDAIRGNEPTVMLEDPEAVQDYFSRMAASRRELTPPTHVALNRRSVGKNQGTRRASYVKEWRPVIVHPSQRVLADPVIEDVVYGYSLVVRALDMGEGEYHLLLGYDQSDVDWTDATKSVAVDGLEGEWEISEPRMTSISMQCAFDARPGISVVAWYPSEDEQYRGQGLFITVKEAKPGEGR